MFRFAIVATLCTASFAINLQYGVDPSESQCGDANVLLGKVSEAIGSDTPSQAYARALQLVSSKFTGQCSQGGWPCQYTPQCSTPHPSSCVYHPDQAAQHIMRDSIILNSWSVSKVKASYGQFYTKAIGKLRIENICGDVYDEIAEFAWYCNEPGKISAGHTMRTEPPFLVFMQKTMACAMSQQSAQTADGKLRGSTTEIPRDHTLFF